MITTFWAQNRTPPIWGKRLDFVVVKMTVYISKMFAKY
jgi:hypothetical protein